MLFKKIFKIFGKNLPSNKCRIFFFRLAGYKIGGDVYIGEDLIISDKLKDKNNLEIGNRVAISPRVTIVTHSNPNNSRLSRVMPDKEGKVTICKDVWLGTGCVILPGITVGECAIVAAGAVVTKNVEPKTIVGGVPAKKISEIDI